MVWILIAIFSYFLTAGASLLDKFLLTSKRVSHPSVYAFYIGLFSLFSLILFFPFGFHSVDIWTGIKYLFSGAVFSYGILLFFFAININEASRVVPLRGAIIPLSTFLFSFFLFNEDLGKTDIAAMLLLIIGGLIISLDFSRKRNIFKGFGWTLGAGILMAGAYVLYKIFYGQDNFINVFIWTRIGVFIGALSLFLVPNWKEKITGSFLGVKKGRRKNSLKTAAIFLVSKLTGGIGSIALNWSMALGSVTLANALVATEYVFVFILGLLLSVKFPKIFQERKTIGNTIQKIFAIIMISFGIFLISFF